MPKKKKIYKMDNDRFLLTLAAMYGPKVKKADRTMTQFVSKLKAVFDKENEGNNTLTAADVKKKYEAAKRSLKAHAKKADLGDVELNHNLPPDIDWTPHYKVVVKADD